MWFWLRRFPAGCRIVPAVHLREIALEVPGARLNEALDGVFARYPNLRGYVLDEHGGVRHHVAVFVDGIAIADKRHPAQALRADSEIYVMQALSGG